MRRIGLVLLLGLILSFAVSGVSFAAEKILFTFEDGTTEGWVIPDWELGKEDYVAENVEVSQKYALDGKSSLELMANFPGARWTGAYCEIEEFFDWGPYSTVSVPVYLPADAPEGLKAQIVIASPTVTAPNPWWIEMKRSVSLVPGKWTVITADLKPGSADWKAAINSDEARQDIRKFGVRVESNNKPAYKGPIYIDKITLTE